MPQKIYTVYIVIILQPNDKAAKVRLSILQIALVLIFPIIIVRCNCLQPAFSVVFPSTPDCIS